MFYRLAPDDDALTPLLGTTIASGPASDPAHAAQAATLPAASVREVSYRIDHPLGGGGMAVTFLGARLAPDGEGLVVVKVSRPGFVRDFGPEATKAALKEAVALQRLNDRVPTTPFVVRLVDSGTIRVEQSGVTYTLPWLALEYVHGGIMGTTLTERVAHSLDRTGAAFDAMRALRALDCLVKGLTAVHEVGVIHRDLKPDNVLCCGSGPDEIFKVADFGIARPVGIDATFRDGMLGTVGYAPPELLDRDRRAVGPWTDVFGLAATFFHLLTGAEYIPARSLGEALVSVRGSARRSLLDTSGLSPDLRRREMVCRAIDTVLALATSSEPGRRPQTAAAFGAALLTWLRTETWRPATVVPRPTLTPQSARTLAGWTWAQRKHASDDLVVRSVAWDADGTFLGATNHGLVFWDGTSLREAPTEGLPSASGIRFVRRVDVGRWLIACDGALFATYTREGVHEVTPSAGWFDLQLFSGDLNDLAVAVGESAEGPVLLGLSGRRWMRPLPATAARAITSLARVSDARWLVAGRAREGGAFAGVYSPLDFEVTRIETPPVRAMVACAADPTLELGVIAGSEGGVVWYEGRQAVAERVGRAADISAAAVDSTGTGWIASAGRILMRKRDEDGASWVTVWREPGATAPIVSLFADVGFLVAVTADGAILEGRCAGFVPGRGE